MNVKHWRMPLASGLILVLAAVGLSACGDDDDDAGGGAAITTSPTSKIQVVDAWARETTNDVSAVYMVIKNSGAADRLVSVTSNKSPKVQIHETVTEGSSMRMQEVQGGIELPENGQVALAPGGYHIMLMNLAAPLKAGEIVDVELNFERTGVVRVEAPVKSDAMTQHSSEGLSPGAMQSD